MCVCAYEEVTYKLHTYDCGVCRSVMGLERARKQSRCKSGGIGAWWCRWVVVWPVEAKEVWCRVVGAKDLHPY